jgi:hypothetical protein
MDLTVNSKIVATLQAQTVRLLPLLGAFELAFYLFGTVHGKSDDMYRWLTISGARITLRSKNGSLIELGLATSDKPVVVRQSDYSAGIGFELRIVLQHYQVELLEAARDGGDLSFNLKFYARASTSKSENYDWEENVTEMPVHVPESAWIAQLNSSKASRILLFEVRLPLAEGTGMRHPADKHLSRAHELLTKGSWRECVSECRQFAEELGGDRLAPALDKLSAGRKLMDKNEREAIVIAALQHYGHAATHSESKHGELDYSREDAKLALSLAASLAAYHFDSYR